MRRDVRRRTEAQASLNDRSFGRLFPRNPVRLPTDKREAAGLLDKIADAMRDDAMAEGPADAGQTFLGQFIDHDVTLDVDSSLARRATSFDVMNQRTPGLDLDCVFGGGPEATPLLYSRAHAGYLLFGAEANPMDLARNHEGVAIIGDPRNDENAFVAAVQGLFIRFYNILLHRIEHDTDGFAALKRAEENAEQAAMRLTRWHYHQVILINFLPSFVDAEVLDRVMSILNRGGLPKGFRHEESFIPAEFSVAAYRFGHATVQSRYDIGGGKIVDIFDNNAGAGGLPAFDPQTDVIDLTRFFGTPKDPGRSQKARPIAPKISAELFDLPFVSNADVIGDVTVPADQARSLAHRNLYRDRFTFELASGQQAAAAMGLTPIDRDANLRAAGVDKIPLWYYCLQEAQERGGGCLHEVGGAIVATVLGRLLRADPGSYWHARPWRSPLAVEGEFTMGVMVDFVNEAWSEVTFADELRTPSARAMQPAE
jgi:hypothetical protein